MNYSLILLAGRNFIQRSFLAICAVLVLAGGFFILLAPVFAASPGEVIINEFSSVSNPEWVELKNTTAGPIDLIGWKLTQLTTPQGIPTEVDLLPLSGTIPAGGILAFDVGTNKLNNPGDSIGLYDNTPLNATSNLRHRNWLPDYIWA